MRRSSRTGGQDAVYDMPPPIDEGKGEAPMEESDSGRSRQGVTCNCPGPDLDVGHFAKYHVNDSDLTKSPGNEVREFEDELLLLTDEEAEWLALLGPDLFWQAWTRRVPKEFRTRMKDGKYLPGRISPSDVVE